jgi:hypothetical protein
LFYAAYIGFTTYRIGKLADIITINIEKGVLK